MGSAVVSAGNDSWVSQNFPTRNHGSDRYLAIRSTAPGAHGGVGLIYFRSPVPAGATVTSAVIEIRTWGTSPAESQTMSLRRVIEPWSESRVTFNTYPSYNAGASASVVIPASSPGFTLLSFDVTSALQAYANGTKNYGFRIDTNATAGVTRLRGFGADVKPVLRVSWSDAPKAPVNLRPNGVVSLSKPTLSFDHMDASGDKTIQAVQFQLDAAGDFTAPDFDSGTVLSDSAQLDLSTTAYAGLAEGGSVFYRARVQDGAGLWSEWSDDAKMTRTAKPAITIQNPPAGADFTEVSPPILWSVASQSAFRVSVIRLDTGKTVFDSGKRGGADNGITLSALPEDTDVRVTVRTWDTVAGRVASPGDPTESIATFDAGVNTDATVDDPINVAVAQVGQTPSVDITWSRALMPDAFALLVAGKVVEPSLDPAELTTDGTNYTYRYHGAKPNVPTVYKVRAVVNGKQSPGTTSTATHTSRAEGIWLVGETTSVALMGDDEGTWSMPDDATVFEPLGGRKVVRVVDGMRGWEGQLSGYIFDGFGGSYAALQSSLKALKNDPTTPVRLVAGDTNFRALIGDLSWSPTPVQRNGQLHRRVSFSFWQVDDFEF